MEKLFDDVESYVFNEFARIILMQHLKTLVNVIQIYEFSQKTLLTQKNQNFASKKCFKNYTVMKTTKIN